MIDDTVANESGTPIAEPLLGWIAFADGLRELLAARVDDTRGSLDTDAPPVLAALGFLSFDIVLRRWLRFAMSGAAASESTASLYPDDLLR